MGSLPVIGWQPLSDAGAIMAGAKAYFYRTGTSTPKNTYSNKALTSANANPVVADAYGRFGDVFLLKDEGYRCVLKTSADVTIYTEDEVFASSLAVDEQTRRVAIARSPIDNSAVGDGVTDDATALQAAITAAGTGVLDLEGKTYRCDSALSLQSGLTLRNGTLDFSACNADNCILAQGTQGANLAFSANEAEGQTTLSMSATTGLAARDLVMLHEVADLDTGELALLLSVSAAVSITTTRPVLNAYTTADQASAAEITPVSNVRLENLRVIGNPSASGTGIGITLDKCKGARLSDVVVEQTKGAAINILRSYDVVVRGCRTDQIGINGEVIVANASADIRIVDCEIDGELTIGEATAAGGTTHHVHVSGCTMDNFTAEEFTRAVVFSGCSMHAGATASIVRGQDTVVSGCHFHGNGVAINDTGASWTTMSGVTISGCVFSSADTGVSITVGDASKTIRGVAITGNVFDNPTSYGLSLVITGTINSLVFNGNALRSGGTSATILRMSTTSTGTIDRFVASGNTQEGGGVAVNFNPSSSATVSSAAIKDNVFDGGISISNVTASLFMVCGNIIEDSTAIGIAIASPTGDLVCSENIISGTFSSAAIAVTGNSGARFSICNNNLSGVAGSACSGISVSGARQLVIHGNNIGAVGGAIDFGIDIAAGANDDMSICGNTINGIADTANNAAIKVNGASASALRIVIANNTMDTPQFAILCTGFLNSVAISGNTINHTHASGAAISIDGTAAVAVIYKVAIVGNTIMSTARCIHINYLCEGATIVGNVLEGGAAINSVVYLSGNAASGVNNFTVCGNAIREGVYGIETSNTAEGIHDGNSFYSQSTAITTGTITAGDSV